MAEDTNNKQSQNELPPVVFWAAGASYGEKNNEDQFPRFIKDNIWEDGWVKGDGDKHKDFKILKEIKPNDYIVVKTKILEKGNRATIIRGIGKVLKRINDYSFHVQWLITGLWERYNEKDYDAFYVKTIAKIEAPKFISAINDILRKYEEKKMALVNDCKKLLEHSHNIILHGAPGTGKTYLARQIAESMGAETCFVQFHPSYDYTDFVEGLRPVPGNETKEIGFERKDGIFKKFCSKALENLLSTKKDNFETIYKMFIDQISESAEPITYETEVQKKPFNVEVNSKDNIYAIPQTTSKTRMPITKESLKLYLRTGKIIDWKPYLTVLGQKMIDLGYQKQSDDIEKKNYEFIIDEINRGELSKIFGELFFSIDPGYRVSKSEIENHVNGVKKINTIKTQYSNMQQEPNEFDVALGFDDDCGHFFVPENVYIIGTMNDIDRNVESMDFAIRRRFAFKEITAADTQDMLDNHNWGKNKPDIEAMKKRMTNLNNAISGIDGLSSAYHIGASYFLKFNLPSETIENEDPVKKAFDNLWNYHLKPLLQEYLRGMEDEAGKMNILKAAYNLEKIYNEKGEEVKNNPAQQGQATA